MKREEFEIVYKIIIRNQVFFQTPQKIKYLMN